MRVLWVSTSNTFYNHTSDSTNSSYNGVGWVAAQQIEILKRPDIELAIMFMTNRISDNRRIVDGVHYYPIVEHVGICARLKRFYFPPKRSVYDRVKDQVESVLADFHPDLIHVFGLECPLSEIIENIDIPSVVHLQGIINPVAISYLPFGFSSETLRKHGVWWRENIFNNGFKYYYNETLRRCKREKQLYKVLKCCTGRTDWDKAVTELYAPQCQYYNVNEILRPDFYSTLPINPRDKIEVLKIASTISETIYKGLDLIVKTAKILNEFDIKFEWRIIGVKANSAYVNLVKHTLGMQISSNVVFEGVKNPQEIIEILDTTDVYVHPSYIDNSPNSVCEAQLLGVPVIATNVGGVSSLITSGETGILVPTNEPHILTSKLIEIKNNFELRKMLSLSGRNAALKRHNCNDIINKIIAIYQNLTNAKA